MWNPVLKSPEERLDRLERLILSGGTPTTRTAQQSTASTQEVEAKAMAETAHAEAVAARVK